MQYLLTYLWKAIPDLAGPKPNLQDEFDLQKGEFYLWKSDFDLQ